MSDEERALQVVVSRVQALGYCPTSVDALLRASDERAITLQFLLSRWTSVEAVEELAANLSCSIASRLDEDRLLALDKVFAALGLPSCIPSPGSTVENKLAIFHTLLGLIASEEEATTSSVATCRSPGHDSEAPAHRSAEERPCTLQQGSEQSAVSPADSRWQFLSECCKHRLAMCRTSVPVVSAALHKVINQHQADEMQSLEDLREETALLRECEKRNEERLARQLDASSSMRDLEVDDSAAAELARALDGFLAVAEAYEHLHYSELCAFTAPMRVPNMKGVGEIAAQLHADAQALRCTCQHITTAP